MYIYATFSLLIHLGLGGVLLLLSFVLGPHPRHMKVPRLGVKSELQLSVYATGTAMPDLSHSCNLHHSSQQHRILYPLREASDRTFIFMNNCVRFLTCCATMGTPIICRLFDDSHSDKCGVIAHCGFDLHVPDD